MTPVLSTPELCKAANVHRDTLQRWMKLGLIQRPQVGSVGRGRRSRWPKKTVKRILVIKEMLAKGLSLREVVQAYQRSGTLGGLKAHERRDWVLIRRAIQHLFEGELCRTFERGDGSFVWPIFCKTCGRIEEIHMLRDLDEALTVHESIDELVKHTEGRVH